MAEYNPTVESLIGAFQEAVMDYFSSAFTPSKILARVLQVVALFDVNFVHDESLGRHQGLQESVELKVCLDFMRDTGYPGVMTLSGSIDPSPISSTRDI
ncbi:hypothetical protein N7454_006891 [Penicillium verhagenii]|nr:hypothetical protein N7454_006891 [Penicillium verhagenii]